MVESLAEQVDSANLTIGDWLLQLSPAGAAVFTFAVAIVQWRTAAINNRESLKPLLEQSLKENTKQVNAIMREVRALNTTLLEAVKGLTK
jgi:hypothetical protein